MAKKRRRVAGLKGRPGRRCMTCDHRKRSEIDGRLGRIPETHESITKIAEEFGFRPNTLRGHYMKHLPGALRVVAARHAELVKETNGLDVMASLGRCADKAERMLAAADAWLRDPNDPEKYNLNPRTHEVEIVYEERVDKLTVRKTARLSDLMRAVEEGLGVTVVKGEARTADPRKLLLDAVASLKPVVELIGKQTGQIKADPKIEIHLHPEVVSLRQRLVAWVVERHPDEAEEIAGLLEGAK